MTNHLMLTRSRAKLEKSKVILPKLNRVIMFEIVSKLSVLMQNKLEAETEGQVTIDKNGLESLSLIEFTILHLPLLKQRSFVDMGVSSMADFVLVYHGAHEIKWPCFANVRYVQLPDDCFDAELPQTQNHQKLLTRKGNHFYVEAINVEKFLLSWCATAIIENGLLFHKLSDTSSSEDSDVSLI